MFRDFHPRKISWRVSVPSDAGNLALDANETVCVAHWNGNKIAAYRATGTLLREWGTQGTADGEFRLPGSIALDPGELPYVPDLGGQSPPELHTNVKFVSKWSELGTRHGQVGKGQPAGSRFAGPQFVAVDQAGNVTLQTQPSITFKGLQQTENCSDSGREAHPQADSGHHHERKTAWP